jgi:glycosyltransferase involved in cell wall biosynthesis
VNGDNYEMQDIMTITKCRRDVMYLTVLPFYRQACIESLTIQAANDLQIFAGPRQLTASVKTGISEDLYTPLGASFIAGRGIILHGRAKEALTADTLMLDLNPRCISAWVLLIVRRMLKRRTIVWGHLYPRAGASAKTARLRRFMRQLADGTVLYGYDSVLPAKRDLPSQAVWVAPNALYSSADLEPQSAETEKNSIIYVGRLVPDKKVDLLIRAFAQLISSVPGFRLKIIGQGSELEPLRRLATQLGCGQQVDFLGAVTTPDKLREAYADAICSVSPGYVGLSLTQSLGFGVPMLIADDEPHAPEVELERFGGVARFKEGDSESLALLLQNVCLGNQKFPAPQELVVPVRTSYSAESMAKGLLDSLRGIPQVLDETGWPAI